MYLKRVDGPRTVNLPDGSVMTRADLPPASTRRWVASRKAAVVRAILHGLISREEALARYGLSGEELDQWLLAAATQGVEGLKVRALRNRRRLQVEFSFRSGRVTPD